MPSISSDQAPAFLSLMIVVTRAGQSGAQVVCDDQAINTQSGDHLTPGGRADVKIPGNHNTTPSLIPGHRMNGLIASYCGLSKHNTAHS